MALYFCVLKKNISCDNIYLILNNRGENMYNEYELRVLNIDKEKFIKDIEKNGAKFVNNYDQKRYVYDFNPIDENRWIRLRTDGTKTTLAIKEYKNDSIGGTEEVEIVVSDMETTDLILEKLGYHKRSIQENRRTRYILDDVEIDIDTWPHLNTYVEFESNNEENIKNVLNKLNIDMKDTTTMNAQDIYLSLGYTQEDMNDLRF